MSISDIDGKFNDVKESNGNLRKTVLSYLLITVLVIAIDNIYALFGHGVRSPYMDYMFLYPLIGGCLVFFILNRLAPGIRTAKRFRLGYNLYNSGIATLTMGSFFTGILEIAGTASYFSIVFFVTGWVLAAAGFIFLVRSYVVYRNSAFIK